MKNGTQMTRIKQMIAPAGKGRDQIIANHKIQRHQRSIKLFFA